MTRLLAGIALLAIAAASFGCRDEASAPPSEAATPTATGAATSVSPVPVASGTTHDSITFGGLERTYRLFVPTSIDSETTVPLVVALHGGLGSGDQFAAANRFEAKAQAEGFIAVFPDGIERTWNGGNCCGQAARRKIDDVGFLAALIEHLTTTLPIDGDRVFMTGHSNGGIMAFRFGCERPDLVRAIAPVAGSLETGGCAAPGATSLLAIHGDADQNHPLEGGKGPRSIAGIEFVSMARSLELWTAAMSCGAPGTTTAGPLTTTTWPSCRDGATASLVVVAGADHPWPGGTGGGESVQGRTATALDATAAVWEFFATFE